MKKIMLVFGTRPEAIKMCPVVKELQSRKGLSVTVCVTGQHREMLQQVLDVFDVRPDYDLSVMKNRQTLFDITDAVLLGIRTVLERTYNLYSPYPEEFNRQAVSIISRYHFAPTALAKKHLLEEKKDPASIFVTGNTAIDALKTTVRTDYRHPELKWAEGSRLILITAHRRENLGEPMEHMFRAIRRVIDEHPDVKAIYPIHKNPAVRETADRIFEGEDRLHLIEPLDVLDFHNFMKKCYLILTDSGGIQEEAPSLGKPVLVMRDTTERPEGIAAGTLKLTGTKEESIYQAFTELLDDPAAYQRMASASNPYGDGYASRRIGDILESGRIGDWDRSGL